MTPLENDIVKFFRGCRKKAKQVRIVADLTATSVETVLEVLKRYGEIPLDVDKQNYQERLKATGWRTLTDGEREYVIGSVKYPAEVASDLRIPTEQVLSIRQKAEREAIKNGKNDNG